MLGYAISFFILAVIAGGMGLGVLSGALGMVAHVLFVIFALLFVWHVARYFFKPKEK